MNNERMALVEAEAALRRAQDVERAQRLVSEDGVIAAAGGVKALGSNEDERKRALGLALLRDGVYRQTLDDLRQAELERDRAAAALESAKDARRERELLARERIAVALESGRALPELLLS